MNPVVTLLLDRMSPTERKLAFDALVSKVQEIEGGSDLVLAAINSAIEEAKKAPPVKRGGRPKKAAAA